MRTPILALALLLILTIVSWFDIPNFADFEVH
jgi:hypothetical protein